jgi:hypothetical protein
LFPPMYPLQHIHAFGQISYKNCLDLPTYRPYQLVDALTAPWHSLLPPVTPLSGCSYWKSRQWLTAPEGLFRLILLFSFPWTILELNSLKDLQLSNFNSPSAT